MKLFFTGLAFSLLSFAIQAADVPTVVEGGDKLTNAECVANKTNDCIQSICMVSSDIDCNSKCKTAAVDKCKENNE